MTYLLNSLHEILNVTVAMAPYLLFGFLTAGILSQVISKSMISRHLGGSGWKTTLKAALWGIPLPICSCGVIPLAASLRKQGAGKGATAAFLASTPQTGVDSLMITYALLGWFFSIFRVGAALVSGLICGIAVNAVPTPPSPEHPDEQTCKQQAPPDRTDRIRQALHYGFISLPKDIAKPMLIGIVISGIISGVVPANFFSPYLGNTWAGMFIMLLAGVPLYVCSVASVPIGLSLIHAGFSPGAVMIFLITGPATNAATLTTLWKIIGKRELAVFLSVLLMTALSAGLLLDLTLPAETLKTFAPHTHESHTILDWIATAVFMLIVLNALKKTKSL